MINANKETLHSFFTNNLQYVVPFFQRSYVWEEENWETLWEHLKEICMQNDQNTTNDKEHFIGTIITKQRISSKLGENKQDLIDGQQRLTTISILLKAIATSAVEQGEYPKLKKQTNDLLLIEDASGECFFRIEHSKNDKEYYAKIMGDDSQACSNDNNEHKLARCYRFFLNELKDFSNNQLYNLQRTILYRVPVISLLLAADDDEQEIFDTINSLGMRLSTAELLKNYIFSDIDLRPHYHKLWEEIFEGDEEVFAFWSQPKTAGRVIRSNIEVLLYCYLIIKMTFEDKYSYVEIERLFREYKTWLKSKNSDEKLKVLEDLKTYATLYFSFPSGTALNEISFSQQEERFFHLIEHLEITTVYPLILFIYKHVEDPSTRFQFLGILEDYLVRRNICKYTTKNYNNLFVKLIGDLSKSITPDTLKDILLNEFTLDTNKYPRDKEFASAFYESALSNAHAREVLFCIALYQINTSTSDARKLSLNNFSVEHIMPKKWELHWNENNLSEIDKINRNKKLKTLGNLTLVTKNLNSRMQNAKWSDKQKALKANSLLRITADYVDWDEWDESSIASRASDLANTALKIWNFSSGGNEHTPANTLVTNNKYTHQEKTERRLMVNPARNEKQPHADKTLQASDQNPFTDKYRTTPSNNAPNPLLGDVADGMVGLPQKFPHTTQPTTEDINDDANYISITGPRVTRLEAMGDGIARIIANEKFVSLEKPHKDLLKRINSHCIRCGLRDNLDEIELYFPNIRDFLRGWRSHERILSHGLIRQYRLIHANPYERNSFMFSRMHAISDIFADILEQTGELPFALKNEELSPEIIMRYNQYNCNFTKNNINETNAFVTRFFALIKGWRKGTGSVSLIAPDIYQRGQ